MKNTKDLRPSRPPTGINYIVKEVLKGMSFLMTYKHTKVSIRDNRQLNCKFFKISIETDESEANKIRPNRVNFAEIPIPKGMEQIATNFVNDKQALIDLLKIIKDSYEYGVNRGSKIVKKEVGVTLSELFDLKDICIDKDWD